MMSGIPVGQVGGLAAAGWIIERHPWPTVFYVFGAAGFLWLCAWIWATAGVVGTTPPRGIPERRGPRQSIPWRQLLTRRRISAIFIALFCGNWGLYFLLSWLPSYFRGAQGLSIATQACSCGAVGERLRDEQCGRLSRMRPSHAG